jgi:hypothetical protein
MHLFAKLLSSMTMIGYALEKPARAKLAESWAKMEI